MRIATLFKALQKLIFLLFLFGALLPARAEPLQVRHLAVLDASLETDDIASVSAADLQDQFRPLKDIYVGGYTQKPRWLKFQLKVPTPGEWWLEIHPAILDDVRIYVPKGDGFLEHRTGDLLPFSAREEPYRAFIFKLNISDHHTEENIYYIRLSSSSTLMAKFRLWQPVDFRNAKNAEYSIASFIAGVLFLMICINIFLWLLLHHNIIAWFSLHLLANLVLISFSSGLVNEFFLPVNLSLHHTLSQLTLPFLLSASIPLLKNMISRHINNKWLNLIFYSMFFLPWFFALYGFYQPRAMVSNWMLITSLPFYVLMVLLATWIWKRTGSAELYLWPGVLLTVMGGFLSTLIMLGWMNIELMPLGFFRPTSFGLILAMQSGILILIHSIDKEQKKSAKQVIRAEVDFHNANNALNEQSRFIGMITHELKTPLAVIDAATQSLQRTAKNDKPNVLWRYDRIRRAVRRIDRLVDQFLSADQIDHIQGQLSVTAFDAASLLDEVVESSLCKAERFKLDAPSNLAWIGDARQLRMALANLVDNAIKYSPTESTIHLSLKICPRNGQMGLLFVVANEGPVIPELLHDKLFFRYTRGDDVGNISGAGLGLYIVKRIAQAHQGDITCHPLQAGTAFHLWLPDRSNS